MPLPVAVPLAALPLAALPLAALPSSGGIPGPLLPVLLVIAACGLINCWATPAGASTRWW